RLQVIPRENPQAAGIDGQSLRNAEFEAEVGDCVSFAASRRLTWSQGLPEPRWRLQILLEIVGAPTKPANEHGDGSEACQALSSDACEEEDGILPTSIPLRWIDVAKEIARFAMPGPAEVAGEEVEWQQGGRKRMLRRARRCGVHHWKTATE